MRKNIAAYTAIGTVYPEFLSINQNKDGSVEISIRSKPDGEKEGLQASITMSMDQLDEIVGQILEAC